MNYNVYYIQDSYYYHVGFKHILFTLQNCCGANRKYVGLCQGCEGNLNDCIKSSSGNYLDGISIFLNMKGSTWVFDDSKWDIENYKKSNKNVKTKMKKEANEALFPLYSNIDFLIQAAIDPKSILVLDVRLTDNIEKFNETVDENDAEITREKAVANELLALLKKSTNGGLLMGGYELEAESCKLALAYHEKIHPFFKQPAEKDGNIAACLIAIRVAKKLPFLLASQHYPAKSLDIEFNGRALSIPLDRCKIPDPSLFKSSKVDFYEEVCRAARKIIETTKKLYIYHEDPYIDRALQIYGSMCEGDKNTWIHEDTTRKVKGIGSTHRKVVNDWLREGTTDWKEDRLMDQIKVLMMVDESGSVQPYEKTALSNACYSPKRNKISANTLIQFLRVLGIPITNTIPTRDKEKQIIMWDLPIAPGIIFFVALREFIYSLDKQAPPLKINFERIVAESGLRCYSILIKLKTERIVGEKPIPCEPFQLVNNFMRERGGDSASETTLALRNLLACKIQPLDSKHNINSPWINIFTDDKIKTPRNNTDENGGICPPVGVCFYPYALRLVWAAGD